MHRCIDLQLALGYWQSMLVVVVTQRHRTSSWEWPIAAMHDGYVFFGCSDWLKLKGRKQPTPSIRVVSIHEVDVTSTIFIKQIPNANPYPNQKKILIIKVNIKLNLTQMRTIFLTLKREEKWRTKKRKVKSEEEKWRTKLTSRQFDRWDLVEVPRTTIPY